MTRTGSQRKVDHEFWIGRLEQGRIYREAAEQAISLAEKSS